MSTQRKATLSHFATLHEYKAYCKGHDEASIQLAATSALLRKVLSEAGPDAVPFHPASISLDLAERIRSYLDACDTLGDKP